MTAHLFAGPLDGAVMASTGGVKELILPDATYSFSVSWSAFFQRTTFVVWGFRGRPPSPVSRPSHR